jgi:hypothetical protein
MRRWRGEKAQTGGPFRLGTIIIYGKQNRIDGLLEK